jgi:hypothetical protein
MYFTCVTDINISACNIVPAVFEEEICVFYPDKSLFKYKIMFTTIAIFQYSLKQWFASIIIPFER